MWQSSLCLLVLPSLWLDCCHATAPYQAVPFSFIWWANNKQTLSIIPLFFWIIRNFHLWQYSAFLGVVLVIQISIGIAAFAYQDSIKSSFKTGLKNSMKSYKNVEANREAVDTMQSAVILSLLRITSHSLFCLIMIVYLSFNAVVLRAMKTGKIMDCLYQLLVARLRTAIQRIL